MELSHSDFNSTPLSSRLAIFFFFNDPAPTEIYTLSLHDALPISSRLRSYTRTGAWRRSPQTRMPSRDRKSTRLNSSHVSSSYAVFCLKKKNAFNDAGRVRQVPDVALSGRHRENLAARR